jgi:hypothetical protein
LWSVVTRAVRVAWLLANPRPAARVRGTISKTRRRTLRVRSRTRIAAPRPRAEAFHGAGQDAHAIGQQRAVRRIMNVGLDEGGVDAQAVGRALRSALPRELDHRSRTGLKVSGPSRGASRMRVLASGSRWQSMRQKAR